jgi:hypothetical protein
MDQDRTHRLRGAVQGSYRAAAPVQALEADLAVLTALVPRRAKKRTLFALIGVGSLVVMPFVGCSQSGNLAAGGGIPLVVFTFLGIVICGAAFVLRGIPIVLRDDKLQTLRALLRRIDFAAGQPVNVNANFAVKPQLVSQEYHAAGARSASYVKVFKDEWLFLEGRLSNGIVARVTQSTLFGREETAHSRFDTATTFQQSVFLAYPPQMNPSLASYGAAIAQHLALPGAKLESVINEPGTLSVHMSYEAPNAVRPEPIAALLAQVVALVDRSRAYVQVDRDAWPPYAPPEIELSAVRI